MISIPGAGALGDLGKLMQLPARIKELQERLATMTVEGEAGDGRVRVTATGTARVVAVRIAPEELEATDPGALGELVAAAVNQALDRAKELAAEEARKALGGLVPPGLAGSLGM